jgi:hypothetical protein
MWQTEKPMYVQVEYFAETTINTQQYLNTSFYDILRIPYDVTNVIPIYTNRVPSTAEGTCGKGSASLHAFYLIAQGDLKTAQDGSAAPT